MATIFPFRALRYNSAHVSVEDVVTQPYDKITPAMQNRYYDRSPYNLVRIILGQRADSEPGDEVYRRSAAYLREWREGGVLRRDAEPSIYAYSQRFVALGDPSKTVYERRGFIALGKIEDYDAGVVHRHEQTLSGPKVDRLNLLRATRTHFGQIFMLYSDPKLAIDNLIFSSTQPEAAYAQNRGDSTAASVQPEIDVTDEYGVQHRVWKISEPSIIKRLQNAMSDKKLIIADGHHRYETALTYRNERRAETGSVVPDAPYERVMMTFVNTDAPGLVVLPTHRVVFGLDGFSLESFTAQAGEFFKITRQRERVSAESAVRILAEKGQAGTALLLVTPEADLLLEARPEAASHALLAGMSPLQRQLDVVLLHKLLLERVLRISEEAIRNQTNVRYLREAQECIEQVSSGEANLAFVMNPVPVEQVREIAFAGEVMPQKSTDFYPKLLSGLTAYALD